MKQNRRVAVVRCHGLAGRDGCGFGCMGCGACVGACPKQAITLLEGQPAAVDREKCVGCGACVRACPRQVIALVPRENVIQPRCLNTEVRPACGAGCIGCGLCARNCPVGAIQVIDHCAVMDQSKCIACGMCAVKCPRGVIRDANGIF